MLPKEAEKSDEHRITAQAVSRCTRTSVRECHRLRAWSDHARGRGCRRAYGMEQTEGTLMREVHGYVLLGRQRMRVLLYGRPVTASQDYELLETNGVQPFDSLQQALIAQRRLEQDRRLESVNIKHLSMRIAESMEDNALLKRNHALIVILEETYPNRHLLFGRPVHGCTKRYDCVNDLSQNEFMPFTSYAGAMDAAFQIAQQSHRQTRLATFHLTHKP